MKQFNKSLAATIDNSWKRHQQLIIDFAYRRRRPPPVPFPGSHRFGDPYWWWWYLARKKWRRNLDELEDFENKNNSKFHKNKKKTEQEKKEEIEHYKKHIDKVRQKLIASADVVEMERLGPSFCRETLRLIQEKNHPHHVPEMLEKSKEEMQQQLRTKGQPRQTVHDPAAALLESMAGEENEKTLLVRDLETTHKWSADANHSWANVFVVDKTTKHPETGENLKRIITDARIANARLENMAKMELFTLETLMNRMSSSLLSSSAKRAYTVSADLRHWFHQIPLPRHFRKYVAIQYETTVDGKRVSRVVYPRAWPMGLHAAPGVGQACTWAMILSDLEDEKVEENDLEETKMKKLENNKKRAVLRKDLGILEHQRFDEYLSWMPLEQGGGVFVLIDNIFVVSPDKKVAELWRGRIADTTNRFNATLKRKKENENNNMNCKEDVDFKILQRGNADEEGQTDIIDFSGIEFSGKGRRVKNIAEDIPELLETTKATEWKTSYRGFASVLGQILWSLRVQGKMMIDITDFIDLYKYAYPTPAPHPFLNMNNNNNKKNNNKLKVQHFFGDLLEIEGSIAHCVSADLKMGKGIALDIKNKYHQVMKDFKNNNINKIEVGDIGIVNNNEHFIYNLVTKQTFNEDVNDERYNKLRNSLRKMIDHMKSEGVTEINIPRLGAGLDKLNWSRVEDMIREEFKNEEIIINIYHQHHKTLAEDIFQQQKETWNSPTTISGDVFLSLKKYYRLARNQNSDNRTNWTPFSTVTSIEESEVVYLATDAAGGEANGIGYIFRKADQKESVWKSVNRDEVKRHEYNIIAYGELYAVKVALEDIFNTYNNNKPKLIMLAIDNQAAKFMIRRGFSPKPEAQQLLKEIFDLLRSTGSKICVDYIRSEDNPADEYSRGDVQLAEEKEEVNRKLILLEHRFKEITVYAAEELRKNGKMQMDASNKNSSTIRSRTDQCAEE
jgi:O-acetyl-ADP-ribose deacetylase (regulator of RNase III)